MESDKDLKSASQPAVEDSEEEENEILEESPCGRWLKRREEVCVVYLNNKCVADCFCILSGGTKQYSRN